MHDTRRVRFQSSVSRKPLLVAVAVAVCLAIPAAVYASNSNPFCSLVEKYSLEWYVMFCNYTESGGGAEG